MTRHPHLLGRLMEEGSVVRLSPPLASPLPPAPHHLIGRRRDWVLAWVAVLLVHGIWWFWFRPERQEPIWKTPTGPSLHVLSGPPPSAAGHDQVWTSALLSLPTPLGFSGAAMPDEIGARPALERPHGPVRYLHRSEYRVSADWTLAADAAVSRDLRRADRGLDVVPPADAVLNPEFWEWTDGVTIELSGDATPSEFLRMDLPESLAAGDSAPWVAEAWLELDERGSARHVFLETSSGSADRDRALLQSLYRWQADPAARATRAQVRVSRVPFGPARPNLAQENADD